MSTDPWSPVVQGHGEDSGVDKYVDEARSLAEQGLVTVSNNNIVLDESSPVELGLSAHATDKYPPPIRYNRLDMLTYHVIYRKEYELYPAYTDFMRADYNKTKSNNTRQRYVCRQRRGGYAATFEFAETEHYHAWW